MGVKASGVVELKAKFRAIIDHLGSIEPMINICDDVKERIEEKTAAHKDYRSRRFAPYSKAYAKRKGVSRGAVDLRRSGTMLGALDARALNPRHGRVWIKSRSMPGTKAKSDMIAQIHTTGTGKQPQREFMNIPESVLQKIVNKRHDDVIMRLLGRR